MKYISKKEMICYGLSAAGVNTAALFLNAFVSSYWTDVVGISAAAVGIIFLVCRIFDGVSDLTMGFVVDKTNSRFGKAKPWVFIGGIGSALMGVLVFSVPEMQMTKMVIFATVTYLLFFGIFNTMAGIATSTMVSFMTDDSTERTSLGASFFTVQIIVMALVTVVTTFAVPVLGGGKAGWSRYSMILAVIAIVFLVIMLKNTTERFAPKPEENGEKVTVKAILKGLTQNKYFFLITIAGLLLNVGSTLMTSVGVYYANHVLKNPNMYSLLAIAALVPNIIGIPLSVPLVSRFGKYKVSVAGLVISVIGGTMIFLAPANIPFLTAALLIKGIGGAPMMASYSAFVAEAADYGQYRTGVAAQGVSFSGTSFGNKVGAGLAGAIMGIVLAIGGYEGTAAVQTDTAIKTIQYLFILGSTLPNLLMIPVILPFKKLQDMMPEINEKLHGGAK